MIVVIYHAYLVGSWKELIKKQLNRIIKSGLYDAADQIHLTINLADVTQKEVEDYLSEYTKLNLEFHEKNYAEYPGIKKVKEIGENYDAKILYFHTKGVSNNWKTFNEKEISDIKIRNVNSWRECMEYFLIDNWKECLEKLKEYDNVGVSCNGGWFWGNFWWTQTSHIKKTRDVELWGRWDYESWLNRDTPQSKNYEFYHMGFNPFISNLIPDFYNGTLNQYKGKKIIIKKALYGTSPFEIDEGYCTMPLNIVSDVTENVKKLVEEKDGLSISFGIGNGTMGNDPIPGQRKCLIVTFHPEGHEDKIIELGATEGHSLEFKF